MILFSLFEKLIPKDHLLVKIDSYVDFSYIYESLEDKYSAIGRGSKDPVMMLKILLLEYLYNLSDPAMVSRIKTDVAFRWFLGLSINDSVPDDTTISHFRVKRLGEEKLEELFNGIVKQCIEKDLIKTKRYMIDTTDVAANVNYPSDKKLIRNAYRKVINEIEKFDEDFAREQLENFEKEISEQYEDNEKVSAKKHFEIADKSLNNIYIKTYNELHDNNKYQEAFLICHDIIDKYLNDKKDKIVSVVDPDARVAHKSAGNIKRGYKDHIIVDEDSEIILASVQTPFNIGDEKKLKELIEKVDKNFEIKPEEISADKVYGTTDNRAYLKDNEIISNIGFYREPEREAKSFGLKDFKISEDVNSVICPNGIEIKKHEIKVNKTDKKEYKKFKFDRSNCDKCSLRDQCLPKDGKGKLTARSKYINVPLRYDAVLNDMKRIETEEFQKASNSRFKIERRFSTLVRNHGLRRCRYLGLRGAKAHITLANMASNIIRMVKLLYQPSIAMT